MAISGRLLTASRSASMASSTALAKPQPSSKPTSPWRARGKRLPGSATTDSRRTVCSPSRTSATFNEAGRPSSGLASPLKASNQRKPLNEYELMGVLPDTAGEPWPARFARQCPSEPGVAGTARPGRCGVARERPGATTGRPVGGSASHRRPHNDPPIPWRTAVHRRSGSR
ncbi:hypothetical protein D3C80_1634460 [compost metagenome]